jgi:GNAT superfamily N-acetyltransferase
MAVPAEAPGCEHEVMLDDVALRLGDDDRELADLLDREIYAFNVEATGSSDGRMLTLRAVDGAGRLVAGLSGWTWGGCAYVDVLWVSTEHRRQGLGTRLMDAAEQEAVARGCTLIVLSTHSFQAPDFYRARGYVQTGRTNDYPVGHAQIHLSLPLGRAALTGHS